MTKATSTRHRRSALSHAIGIICCRSLMSTVERIHITDAGRRAIERWVAAHRDSRIDGHFSAHGMPDPAPRASAGQNEEQLPKMMPKLAAGTVRGHTLAQFFAAALAHFGADILIPLRTRDRTALVGISLDQAGARTVLYAHGARAWLYLNLP